MSRPTICVDAGPVIRLVISADSHQTRELWKNWENEGRRVVAPSLLFYEVTSVIYRYQRQDWISDDTAHAALAAALALPVELVTDPNLHLRARAASSKYDLPAAYDAHYLALAEHLDAELWTADVRLVNAVKPYGVDWVRLLASG